jgi:error-prone DNA polymerase
MGFWSPAVVVNDAKRHNVRVLPVDVNLSEARCMVQEGAVRLGFNYVHGFGDEAQARVIDARGDCAFKDLSDFCRRTQLPQRLIENLILAGAMDGWRKSRRKLLWELGTLDDRVGTLSLPYEENTLALPEVNALEAQELEYALLGVTLHDHPMRLYRAVLHEQRVLDSQQVSRCRAKTRVKVGGMVVVHQAPPTAKGFHFITLEDESGFLNIVVRPDVYVRFRKVVRGTAFLLVEGVIERQGIVANVVAQVIRPLQSV